jgi:transposase
VSTGVDAHLDTHTAAVCDAPGRAGAQLQVPGYCDLPARAEGVAAGRRLAWAIEGTRHYGLGLARHLAAAGQQVSEIDGTRHVGTRHVGTRHVGKRRAGKSDPIDAVRAARELLARPRPG